MEKVMIAAALVLMTMTAQAQMSVDRSTRKYRHSPKAEYVYVPKMMMSFAKTTVTNNAGDCSKHIEHINSIKVLDMEDCPKTVKQQFFKDVVRLKTVGYEELTTTKEADEQTVIMMKRSKTRIEEPVIIDSGDDDATLIQALGNIRNLEIQGILTEEKKEQPAPQPTRPYRLYGRLTI